MTLTGSILLLITSALQTWLIIILVRRRAYRTTGPLCQQGGLLGTIFAIEIVVRCLQAGVFLLVFVLARFFNLYWRQYAFGIAAGFFVSTFGLVLVKTDSLGP
jgi:hypothetical protein